VRGIVNKYIVQACSRFW